MLTPCHTLDDKPRSGHPSTSRTHDKSTFTNELIQENRGITIEELAANLEVSVGSAFSIVKSLGYHKICSKWVPKKLSQEQKHARVRACRELRQMFEEDANFFLKLITGDETWVYYYEPETKQQSMEQYHTDSPRKRRQKGAQTSS